MSQQGKIRHIAIRTSNPEKMCSFYQETFGFEVIGRTPGGAIYMSDGYMNLALLTAKDGKPFGIDHFGVRVESFGPIKVHTTVEKATQIPGQHSEYMVHDVEGNRVDVMTEEWPH
ncbi:MAG TPA: VOC family protein [Candidatus Binatia bacterium]|jgi:catechol 2,3-dioxygenase-like lactoylglutathione lyase family enzyme